MEDARVDDVIPPADKPLLNRTLNQYDFSIGVGVHELAPKICRCNVADADVAGQASIPVRVSVSAASWEIVLVAERRQEEITIHSWVGRQVAAMHDWASKENAEGCGHGKCAILGKGEV